MKKLLRFLCTLMIVFTLIGCGINNEERVAAEFIASYYAQFERRSDLVELKNSQFAEEQMETFITQSFDELLTRNAIDTLVSNRLIPKLDVLESNIATAKITGIKFGKADNQIEGTLSFKANIKYTYNDGNFTEEIVTGLIRIVSTNGKYKVDSFKITDF